MPAPVITAPRQLVTEVGVPVQVPAAAPGATGWSWTHWQVNGGVVQASGLPAPTITGAATATPTVSCAKRTAFTLRGVASNADGPSVPVFVHVVCVPAVDE
jgi:hypothetical protein